MGGRLRDPASKAGPVTRCAGTKSRERVSRAPRGCGAPTLRLKWLGGRKQRS